jgi:hypothetical protein
MIKKFLIWLLIRILIILAIAEISCRIFIDKKYFQSVDLYKEWDKKRPFDFIFIGSSRMAAAILPDIFKNDSDQVVINAGRGYSTAVIHYKALTQILEQDKNALKNCKVIIEAPGGVSYIEDGSRWFYDEDPHLIVPYLKTADIVEYVFKNKNSLVNKIDLVLLYSFAAWRDCFYEREQIQIFSDYHLKRMDVRFLGGPDQHEKSENIAARGGTKSDSATIKIARQLAYQARNQDISEQKVLTMKDIENSMISKICSLIRKNGGQVFLLDMPESSVLQSIYETPVAKENKKLFDQWLSDNKIRLIVTPFVYTDADFPDNFHLRESRVEEFSELALYAVQQYCAKNPTKAR